MSPGSHSPIEPDIPANQKRLQTELDAADAAVVRILSAAPRAVTKYKDVGRAGHAVLAALERALTTRTKAKDNLLRWQREAKRWHR